MFASVELDQSLQGLLSFERLDRASPDLWPEQSESRFVDLVALIVLYIVYTLVIKTLSI